MQLQEKVNKRAKMFAVSITVIGSLMLSGCGSRQAPPKPDLPEVAVVTVHPERVVLTTELPGRTSAYFVAEIRPQVSGIVQERLFNEGSDIKAGSVLYRIDPAPYQAAYDNALAALARSKANLEPVRLKAERYKELIAKKAISQQDFDNADAALKQAEADIEYAKATVESARINLAYTRITAPISGRIGKSDVTVGALATAYQGSPFATIQQLDPIYVDATQSSANLLELKRNISADRIKGSGPDQARVRLLLEDGTPYLQEGTLKFSEVTVDPSTGSFILRMIFPNSKHILLAHGEGVMEATLGAVRVRFRPVIMTSMAFFFGVLPLALATGAGTGAMNAIGTAVTGGMLSATFIDLFYIPLFFALVYRVFKGKQPRQTQDVGPESATSPVTGQIV